MKEKKRMSARAWLWMFGITLLLAVLFVPAVNMYADPYGALGDHFLHWWSYDMTLNPRLAKISYLEQNKGKYDSFILGSSGSSSIPVEALNEYLDASFYNLFFYGTETETVEELAVYLLNNCQPKNLVLNLSLKSASAFSEGDQNKLTKHTSWRVSGESPLDFYLRYLFADPSDSFQKLDYLRNDGYLQTPYKVFNPETGSYDKSRRDVEPIGDLDEYLQRDAYKVFLNYPKASASLPHLEEAMQAVSRIKALCEEKGTRLLVLCQPAYVENAAYYSREDQAAFFNALAQVTDYWDFTLTPASCDPRYFYDSTHFRNAVGKMMLARIFDDDSVYTPDNFGRYVRQGDTPGAPECEKPDEAEYTVRVPFLRYHHLVEGTPANDDIISLTRFEEQMDALDEAGYTPVGIDDLRAYVEQGKELPEKPVMITFDDGYESNYSLAFPVLQQHGFKATIFVIGVSIGKDSYKDTGVPMYPHFSLEQAREMEASGLITVASHGWNVHEVKGRDPEPIRPGALKREDETEEEYVAFLTEDALHMRELLGEGAGFFSYPTDQHNELCLVVLSQAGVYATVSGDARYATLIKGLPQSLYNMPRNFVYEEVSGEDLIAMLEEPS